MGLVPTQGPICDHANQANNEKCPVFNIFLVWFWHIGEFFNYYSPAITGLAGVAVAWFTLALRQSTEKLWKSAELQREAEESRRKEDATNLSESLDIAKKNADAATLAAKTGVDTLVLTQRAFLFVKALDFQDGKISGTDEDLWVFISKWENKGNTPAIHAVLFQTASTFLVNESPIYPPFSFVDENVASASIGPGVVVEGAPTGFTRDQLIQVRDEKRVIFIGGRATYNDVFADTPRRETRYCFRMSVRDKINGDGFGFTFTTETQNNYST